MFRINDSTFIFLAIPFFIGVELVGACNGCEGPENPTPKPEPTATATTSAPAPPPAPPPAPEPPKPAWERVGGLERLLGRWGGEMGAWAEMAEQTPDGTLYPWYLSFGDGQGEPYDCGLFERINEPEGWRVAYCKGGDIGPKRRAESLIVETKQDAGGVTLRIQLPGSYEIQVIGAPDGYFDP